MIDSGEGHPWPQRLHHAFPAWVRPGAEFHVRIRAHDAQAPALIENGLGIGILQAAEHYHRIRRWHCRLLIVMPDHVHALLAFPSDAALSVTVGAWKKYLACSQGIRWQSNFFDHRIRSPLEGQETWEYIRRNPVVAELCAHEDEWPWHFTP